MKREKTGQKAKKCQVETQFQHKNILSNHYWFFFFSKVKIFLIFILKLRTLWLKKTFWIKLYCFQIVSPNYLFFTPSIEVLQEEWVSTGYLFGPLGPSAFAVPLFLPSVHIFLHLPFLPRSIPCPHLCCLWKRRVSL